MDFFFFLDMIFAFFTTTSDTKKATEVTDLKTIGCNYIKSWFFVDLMSIVPFDMALSQLSQGGENPEDHQNHETNLNSVVRVARFSKIYKLFRIMRLVKVFKLLKNKD